MFGKFFASTFTGSMYGSGPVVFSVWGYVIAHTVDAQVELNPKMMAPILGTTEAEVAQAIDFLCQPDPHSRTKLEDGKRLIREGQFAYRVPTYFTYRDIRNEEERREYNRIKKAEQRARMSKTVSLTVNESIGMSKMSAQAEAEADTEVKSRKGGGVLEPSKSGNGKTAPPSQFKQNDFDERDWRKISEAKRKITERLKANIGGEGITDAEFWAWVAEESGVVLKRVMELQKTALET